MTGPLSFRKAAAALGMGNDRNAADRLRRLVLAREQTAGATIAFRGQGSRRPVRGVTLVALKRYLPELLPRPAQPQGELSQRFRAYLDEIDDRLRGIAREEADAVIAETVRPQLDELREQDRQTLEMIAELAERVAVSLRPGNASKRT
jgi:hypothetical protein